eukprot:TRINITY_DN7888_c0_g1_i1.p1 TRINITY_DN7888_c0_g1~~TRINITY_DN7888_c0_g1_i1.p1  ORF type:complete len:175 (-),score=11.24 TRINITY_DN7888_c0_g1_i1:73-597(-)
MPGSTTNCNNCHSSFLFFLRSRINCRRCHRDFCPKCCSEQFVFDKQTFRVCGECANELRNPNNSQPEPSVSSESLAASTPVVPATPPPTPAQRLDTLNESVDQLQTRLNSILDTEGKQADDRKKECVTVTELLMQSQLKADEINDPDVRAARKALTGRIQGLLDQADTIRGQIE